jgi:hypothetical protein
MIKRFVFLIFAVCLFASCVSTQKEIDALNDPERLDNVARGNPLNTANAKAYLLFVLSEPQGREVKAYERRAYSPENKKSIFVKHGFYVFLKNGALEHTLVFTATPKTSEHYGAWMLDARSDVESYASFLEGDNEWELVEYRSRDGKGLDTQATIQKILKRVDENRAFWGASAVRDLPWYHHVWMALVPPPILVWSPLLFLGIGKDSCLSAVLETMVFE